MNNNTSQQEVSIITGKPIPKGDIADVNLILIMFAFFIFFGFLFSGSTDG